MQNILIVGGGFAGVWSAMTAAAIRQRLGRGPTDIRITLVTRDPYLTIRPRLYESNVDQLRVPLADVFAAESVETVVGEVTAIDTRTRRVTVHGERGQRPLVYDRLILAAGSRLRRPDVDGAATHAYSVDTFAEAVALEQHLSSLAQRAPTAGRFTAVVVGGGFTGLEVATELVARLRKLASAAGISNEVRVILIERREAVGLDFSPAARASIETALRELEVEVRSGATVAVVSADGVRLADGEWIPAATIVWTGGFLASSLAEQLDVRRDELGRLPVDECLRVRGVDRVFAAGDIARVMADGDHVAPMSCQIAIPMGEAAGRNAVLDLLGAPLMAFSWHEYVTCLDLGTWGAVFTEGWDRQLRLDGHWAKVMKQTINERLIYPPTKASATMAAPVARLDTVRAA